MVSCDKLVAHKKLQSEIFVTISLPFIPALYFVVFHFYCTKQVGKIIEKPYSIIPPTSKKLKRYIAFGSFVHPSVSTFVMLSIQSRMARDRILKVYIWNKDGKYVDEYFFFLFSISHVFME